MLEDLSRRATDLAAVLPELQLPPEELQRIAVRLVLIEEGVSQLGPA